MRSFYLGAWCAVGAACALFFLQCSSAPDYCYGSECLMSAEAGADVDPPTGCYPAVDPKDSPACVDDSYAIFVNSDDGDDDSGLGTQASPVKSINHALSLLGGRPRIYICGTGTLDEHVELASVVSLIGGYDCSWEYTGQKPKVSPTTTGPALTLTKLSDQVIISDLAFEAQDATSPGESSVAVIANQSSINFWRCDLKAGDGQSGDGGATGTSNYNTSFNAWDSEIRGHDATGIKGGEPQTCVDNPCVDGKKSTGGEGGKGGTGADAPSNGGTGYPIIIEDNSGIANTVCEKGGIGGTGATGENGASSETPTPPASGRVTSASGVLNIDGTWKPAMSQAGASGGVGQGGGGGGGGIGSGAIGGGGGGGCGGCGGAAGGSAQAGGASIALISYKSQVSLTGCTLTAGQAGKGGNGAPGQDGQPGGSGGVQSATGCSGGGGGNGGAGGSSAGGAGGIAAGILWTGDTPPMIESPNITRGYKGSPGTGGTPGSNNGLDGQVGNILEWTQ